MFFEVLLHLHKTLNDTDVVVKLTDANNTTGVILKKDSNQDFYISNTHSNGDIFMGVSGREKTLITNINNLDSRLKNKKLESNERQSWYPTI